MVDPGCINLKSRFGDCYRISFDPTVETDPRLKKDPWYFVMQCKAGELSPQDGSVLHLEMPVTNRRRRQIMERLKGRVSTIKFADIWVLLFEADDFDLVADLIVPRKRRRMTNEQKKRNLKRPPSSIEQGVNHALS